MTGVASRISQLERAVAAVSQKQGHGERTIAPFRPSDDDERLNIAGRTVVVADREAARNASRPASEPPPSHHGGSSCTEASSNREVLLRTSSSSQYINELLLSHVIQQEDDVRSAISTAEVSPQEATTTSPFNPMGILSSRSYDRSIKSYLPPQPAAIYLWRVYVDRVDPCSKVLHIPTDQITIYTVIDDPDRASPEAMAICYAVLFAAVVVLEPTEITIPLQDDKHAYLTRFKLGLEQAFAHSEFLEAPTIGLLQAFSIYLTTLRVHNSGRGIWLLHALAIRAAEAIGLHRDGTILHLTPFESEIRRRLWWHLIARDVSVAEDHGFASTSTSAQLLTDVSLPRNLEDVDLRPDMVELPTPRSGWTRMTLSVARFAVSQACGRLMGARCDTREQQAALRAQTFGEVKETLNHSLRSCSHVVPEQRIAVKLARFMFRKADLVYRQRESMCESDDLAAEDSLLEAVEILEEVEDIWKDDLLQPFSWLIRSYPQSHMMLYILWHICVRPMGPHTERALQAVDKHLRGSREADAYAANTSKWKVLTALKAKAVFIINSSKLKGDGPGKEDVAFRELYVALHRIKLEGCSRPNSHGLAIRRGLTEDRSESWSARICHDPDGNRVSFEWDLQLHDAVCDLLPSATPNHLFYDQGREDLELDADNKVLMMSLHRDFLQVDGFRKTRMAADPAVNEMVRQMGDVNIGGQHERLALPMLPFVGFLKGNGRSGWSGALLSEVSEADQCPLRYYLSNRPLGFGIIATGRI
ncbi:hypothetical protein FANTH_4973 [Fusarium anthophilum]|uniref:Xylanolytic transcriptional activator regulatory domain-containing protein n=1 Tax=Fusarium anthophilum TaxID=48485 RepID=A0A8H5E776_9HYPO|nr:hypothetical protein FANTH_4973 [Fusarium anthophilum]